MAAENAMPSCAGCSRAGGSARPICVLYGGQRYNACCDQAGASWQQMTAEDRPELTEASEPLDFAAARELFLEYAAQLPIDLRFQGFTAELDHLTTMYAPPSGCLILARSGDHAIGCGALRRLSDDVCEMKRLYLRPQARGTGLGRTLAERLVQRAKALGYARMCLDTLLDMHPARRLYVSLGFRETAPYYDNPLPDVVYMELDLANRDQCDCVSGSAFE
jgi:putative acetyltransferase